MATQIHSTKNEIVRPPCQLVFGEFIPYQGASTGRTISLFEIRNKRNSGEGNGSFNLLVYNYLQIYFNIRKRQKRYNANVKFMAFQLL